MLSVLEVNSCGIENIFFDEFDTYIESKEQSIEKTNIEKKNQETPSHLFLITKTHFVNHTFLLHRANCLSLYLQAYYLQKRKLTILQLYFIPFGKFDFLINV